MDSTANDVAPVAPRAPAAADPRHGSARPARRPVPPAHAPRARGWAAELPLAVALAAHLAVVLALGHFPFQDLPNHLARYAVLARTLGGAPPAWLDVRLIPTAYIGLDLVGAALVASVGAFATGKLFGIAGVLAVPLGMRRLLAAVAPGKRGWAVAGTLLAFSAYYLSSYLSYVVGVGAALAWLAAWWPRRAAATALGRAGLALGVVGLYLIHLSAPLIALAVVGVELLWAAGPVVRGPAATRRAVVGPRLATIAACVAGLAAVWGGCTLLAGTRPSIRNPVPVPPPPPVGFRTPASKVLALAYPFYTLSLAQGAVMAGGYAVALALFLREEGRAALRHPVGLAALALLAVYVVWPLSFGETRAVDARWLLAVYALPFCAAAADGRAPSARALGAVAALAVLHAGAVFAIGRRLDRDLDAYDRVLARVPVGARVLPLVTPTRRHPDRVTPYLHHAQWHVANRGGRVAGFFGVDGLVDDGYSYSHLAHVRERDRFYFYPETWGADSAPPLPWARIWRDADAVIHAGDDDPRVRAEVGAHGRAVYRDGDVTLYAPSPAGGRP